MLSNRPRIAVIGGGISGLTTAYYLSKSNHFEVSVFEARKQLGGHAFTVHHQGVGIDTAVVGFHLDAYPNFVKLVRELGVIDHTHHFKQDLCFHSPKGVEFFVSHQLQGVLTKPLVLAKTLRALQKFSRAIVAHIQNPDVDSMTLEDFLRFIHMTEHETRFLILPMVHMFVGLSFAELRLMPARFLIDLLFHHKVLHHSSASKWRAWDKGTVTYISKLQERINGPVHVGVEVKSVQRPSQGSLQLKLACGESQDFEIVVLATPAGLALKMIEAPTALEERLLKRWDTGVMRMCVHRDSRILPPKSHTGFWNPYVNSEGTACGASYLMHKIHPAADKDILVSWEPIQSLDESKIIYEEGIQIGRYTGEALQTHKELHLLNQQKHNIYFCGAHFGHGWHESGVVSGMDVVTRILEDQRQETMDLNHSLFAARSR